MQADVEAMGEFIKDELNVQDFTFDSRMDAWCSLSAVPDFKTLGRVLGKQLPAAAKEVRRFLCCCVACDCVTSVLVMLHWSSRHRLTHLRCVAGVCCSCTDQGP